MLEGERFSRLDKTVQGFLKSVVNISLYVLLMLVSVIAISDPDGLGAAVIASCGLAIGLSAGALGNFAWRPMI
jgi:hypothetical protein